MDVGPNCLAHECGNAMRDSGERRRGAGSIDESAVQIHAVVERAIARAAPERGRIQHGDENDSSQHVFRADFAHQTLDRHRPFVLVAVIGAERDESFAGLALWADKDSERNQVIAPNAVVLQGDPIVAATGRFEIELVGTNDLSCHVAGSALRESTIGLVQSMNRQQTAEIEIGRGVCHKAVIVAGHLGRVFVVAVRKFVDGDSQRRPLACRERVFDNGAGQPAGDGSAQRANGIHAGGGHGGVSLADILTGGPGRGQRQIVAHRGQRNRQKKTMDIGCEDGRHPTERAQAPRQSYPRSDACVAGFPCDE